MTTIPLNPEPDGNRTVLRKVEAPVRLCYNRFEALERPRQALKRQYLDGGESASLFGILNHDATQPSLHMNIVGLGGLHN